MSTVSRLGHVDHPAMLPALTRSSRALTRALTGSRARALSSALARALAGSCPLT
ncbi:MAG: hypothetical protein LBV06_06795 [Propionibacteriaceae bacterium]|nr:hypothetical protein [Propionibacteriaceae bacterium]